MSTSLPSRERGLKSALTRVGQDDLQSLPSRERGLKSGPFGSSPLAWGSLPSRERGLKLEVDITPLPSTGRSLHGSVD